MIDHAQSNDGLVKVVFDVIEKDGSFNKTESMWAEPVGDNRYRLRNVPYLVFGFSEQDVVTTREVEGRLAVSGVASRGGHSTYRLVLPEDTTEDQFLMDWAPLSDFRLHLRTCNATLHRGRRATPLRHLRGLPSLGRRRKR
jgi:hypothetical protein